jgi:hypothetical protein
MEVLARQSARGPLTVSPTLQLIQAAAEQLEDYCGLWRETAVGLDCDIRIGHGVKSHGSTARRRLLAPTPLALLVTFSRASDTVTQFIVLQQRIAEMSTMCAQATTPRHRGAWKRSGTNWRPCTTNRYGSKPRGTSSSENLPSSCAPSRWWVLRGPPRRSATPGSGM